MQLKLRDAATGRSCVVRVEGNTPLARLQSGQIQALTGLPAHAQRLTVVRESGVICDGEADASLLIEHVLRSGCIVHCARNSEGAGARPVARPR